MDSRLPGFHRLTRGRRVARLKQTGWLAASDSELLRSGGFDTRLLETVSENMVSFMSLPVGVVPNVIVNGRHVLVPMATEEPSIVAACSRAALLTGPAGGVTANSGERRIGAQVLYRSQVGPGEIRELLSIHKELFMDQAGSLHPRVAAAGGGVLDIEYRPLAAQDDGLGVFDITCNPGDAMGANFADDIADRLARFVAYMVPGEVMGAIVTNYPLGTPASAAVRLPAALLEWKDMAGIAVAGRVAALSAWARVDPLRRATHVKGILNGVFAVMTPLYQDVRAQAAVTAAWLAGPGKDEEVCSWWVEDDHLVGALRLPLTCATAGGTGPHVKTTALYHRWMGVHNAGELEEILATVGLLQNLGALTAIATEGICRGHMRLHDRKHSK